MTLGLIWAQAQNRVIGRDGTIPWRIPEDLAHFRAVTGTGAVVMGRRTWDSLPPRFRPLPNRRNIVVTRQGDWSAAGAQPAASLEDALTLAHPAATGADGADGATVWLIGGAQLYRQALPLADVLEVTEIDSAIDGDTLAPHLSPEWLCRSREPAEGWRTSSGGLRYRFLRYTR